MINVIFTVLFTIVLGLYCSKSAPVVEPDVPVMEENYYVYTGVGKALYIEHCSSCHGLSGNSDGTFSVALKKPAPRFLDETYQWVNGLSEEGLRKTLRDGIPKTYKTSYAFLKESDRDEIIKYVRYLSAK